MAIFLLLYVLMMLVWLSWSAVLTYIVLKYKYPDNVGFTRLIIYWGVCALIFVVSFIFISTADWVTVPAFFKSIGV